MIAITGVLLARLRNRFVVKGFMTRITRRECFFFSFFFLFWKIFNFEIVIELNLGLVKRVCKKNYCYIIVER